MTRSQIVINLPAVKKERQTKIKKMSQTDKPLKSKIINEEVKKIRKSSAWVQAAQLYKKEKNCSYKQALIDLKKKKTN